jgi:guanosine-3',5'-bis(diphosphate) 3'-pyrophosphohydrolase
MKIELLLENLPEYYTPADRDLIERAYKVAEHAHREQKRASGEPYISHCVAVSSILAELRVPANVVAAALLHDTVEDTDITLDELEEKFGSEIAHLVDGVTKLTHLPRVSRSDQHIDHVQKDSLEDEEQRALAARRGLPDPEDEELSRTRSRKADLASETLRKTFLAMGEDIRVVLIKLADRLHNMRTLGYVPESKRKRIARQTLDIFAPLASRLGILLSVIRTLMFIKRLQKTSLNGDLTANRKLKRSSIHYKRCSSRTIFRQRLLAARSTSIQYITRCRKKGWRSMPFET